LLDTDFWLYLSVVAYCAVALAVLVHAVWKRGAGLFDPLVQCIAFISLFTLPLPLRALISDTVEGDVTEHLAQLKPYLPAAVAWVALGLICLSLGYYSRMSVAVGRLLPRPSVARRARVYSATIVLGVFSISLVVLLAKSVGGLVPFILLGYDSSAETFGRGYLAIGFPWLFVASLLLLYRYALYRRRRDLLAFVAAFVLLSLVQILLGNRSTVLYMALTVGFFVHYAVRPLRAKVLLPLAVVGFLFLNLVGLLRSSKYESLSDVTERSGDAVSSLHESGALRQGWFYTLTTGEFVVPFETMPAMVRSVGTEISPKLGMTFLRAPLFYVPSVVFPARPLPLANWYMATFYGSGFGLNQGRAFYFLAEGYLNFGPAGVMLVMLAWGVFWGGVREYIRLSAGEPGAAMLVALSLAYIFRAVSGDATTLLVALPEQSLIGAVLGLALATRFRPWTHSPRLSSRGAAA
jgi:hypothetical protein